MERIKKLENMFTLPGQELAVIEEFIPGEGVYVRNGIIYSARLGHVQLDMKSRRISVAPLKEKRIPRRGFVFYGVAQFIPREDLVVVRMCYDERMNPLHGEFTGVLHVSQASDKFIDSILKVVKPGDIIKAVVLSDEPPYIISIKQPQYGVVLAFCSVCGAPLARIPGQDHLVCTRCRNREHRKTSTNYLLVLRGTMPKRSSEHG